MRLPRDDGFFKPTVAIIRQPDGSCQTHIKDKIGKHYEIRMLVTTPRFYDEWKNIEVTGYMEVVSIQSKNASIGWSARGGVYNSSNPVPIWALRVVCTLMAHHFGKRQFFAMRTQMK